MSLAQTGQLAGGGEALSLRAELGALVRSRMAGVLGFTYRADEALEIVTDAGHAVVFVHQNDAARARWRLVPRALQPGATCEVVVLGAAQVVELRPLEGH